MKLKVEVDDWDTGKSVSLILPCDIRQVLDTSHELQVIDWEADIPIGYYDDVVSLNKVLENINDENPCMTLDLLEKILDASGSGALDDSIFIEKICNNDFMLEELIGTEAWLMNGDEEKCACYLATEMMIPFAKNITTEYLRNIHDNSIDAIDWSIVWRYYTHMGFKIIKIKNTIYAFHWGNAIN